MSRLLWRVKAVAVYGVCLFCFFSGCAWSGEFRGRGWFVNGEGVLITAWHVVWGASALTVSDSSGREAPASVLYKDERNDVALLRTGLRGRALPTGVAFAARRGEEVCVLGYPMPDIQGRELKATFGRINALSGAHGDERFMQIDAAVQPGNSGGPVLNAAGVVVGMVARSADEALARRRHRATPQNVNYALKAEYLIRAMRLAGVMQTGGPEEASGPGWPDLLESRTDGVVLITVGR
jgi:S1-C subfamily serine protease